MKFTKDWAGLSVIAWIRVFFLALPIALSLLLVALALQGCGGSGESSAIPPVNPPPPPDFTINIDGTSLTAQQQGSPQTFGVAPEGQFSGAVLVTIQNLPIGVSAYPPGPFNLASNAGVTVMLFASASTPVGNYTVTIAGTLGQTTHTAAINLTVGPVAPFHLSLSQSSLSMNPATQLNLTATVSATAGSLPTSIQLSFSQLPTNSGVEWAQNPIPTVTPTSWSEPVAVTATVFAQPLQNFPWLITATSGNSASSVVLPVSVSTPFAAITKLIRSTFVRTDEDVSGALYDRTRKLVFVTVEALNEVLVYSSTDASLRATIPVDRPWGIDEAADGTRIYVGSWSDRAAVIDPDLLQVVQLANAPSISGGLHYNLETVAALSDGNVVISGGVDAIINAGIFFLWNTTTNSISTLSVPQIFVPGAMYGSPDHSKVLLLGLLTSGGPGAVWLDGSTEAITSVSPPDGGLGAVAFNSNASQIASFDGQHTVTVYDANFNPLGNVVVQGVNSAITHLIFSLDGRYLYEFATFYPAAYSGIAAVIDTSTFKVIGVCPDLGINSASPTNPLAIDETGMVFGSQPAARGLTFLDVSSPGALSFPFFSLGFPLLNPNLLSQSSPEQAIFTGTGFDSSTPYQVYFGAPPSSPSTQTGSNVSVGANGFTVRAPAGRSLGAANVTVGRPDGWYQISPNSVSYGPQITYVDVNSGTSSGGSKIVVFGYGFPQQGTELAIGGTKATITNILGPGAISPFPFAMESIEATTTPGTPGFADVSVTTPFGSTTLSSGFQYLSQTTVYPLPGALNQIVFDSRRQRLYISNTDHNRIEVFSLTSNSFLSPIPTGNSPIGIALSSDGAKLAAANNGDGTVTVIDPSQMTTLGTYSAVASIDSGCEPYALTPIQGQKMLVDTFCPAVLSAGVFEGNVHLLDLNSGSLSCAAFTGCMPDGVTLRPGLPQVGPQTYIAFAASADGSKVVFDSFAEGIIGLIDLNANSVSTTGISGGGFPEINSDGSLFGTAIVASPNLGPTYLAAYNSQMQEVALTQDIDYLGAGPNSFSTIEGAVMNPSGSLFYQPEQTGMFSEPLTLGIDLFDVHSGRLAARISVTDPLVAALAPITLDSTGDRIFALSSTGLTVVQLARAPLSIASANPAQGTSGTPVTIRGSGFVSGTTLSFGTMATSATFVDSATLQVSVPSISAGTVRVTVSNPDGTQYSYDGLFQVQ